MTEKALVATATVYPVRLSARLNALKSFPLIEAGQWFMNGLDVDEISEGKYNDGVGKVIIQKIRAGGPSLLVGRIYPNYIQGRFQAWLHCLAREARPPDLDNTC